METRCNNCMTEFANDDELKMVKLDSEFVKVCPKCLTDEYLMDLEETIVDGVKGKYVCSKCDNPLTQDEIDSDQCSSCNNMSVLNTSDLCKLKNPTFKSIIDKVGTRFKFVEDVQNNLDVEYMVMPANDSSPWNIKIINISKHDPNVGSISAFKVSDEIMANKVVMANEVILT